MEDFKSYLEAAGDVFPVEESQFSAKLKEFSDTPLGVTYKLEHAIGFQGDTLRTVHVTVVSIGVAFDSYENANPIFEDW